MTFITRTVSAIAFTATLFATSSAFALTPFQAATQAYRGQLDGISSYGTLQGQIRSGNVTGEDILEAAGLGVMTGKLLRSASSSKALLYIAFRARFSS